MVKQDASRKAPSTDRNDFQEVSQKIKTVNLILQCPQEEKQNFEGSCSFNSISFATNLIIFHYRQEEIQNFE